MHCPKCNADFKKIHTIDSRESGEEIRRRRVCKVCGYRFTTYEMFDKRKARLEAAERDNEFLKKELAKKG